VQWVDLPGYSASILVFMTFYMKDMIKLRLLALCSNVAFLIYACPLHLFPILVLHGALIPINVCRLIAACRDNAVARGVRATQKNSSGVGAAGGLMKPRHQQSRALLTNAFPLLRPTSNFLDRDLRVPSDQRQSTTPVTWTCYPRALICLIGALVVTIGIFLVITTAPAGPSELSFCEPVG
jgi:hypothetical protein